jgi:hypothetical protein
MLIEITKHTSIRGQAVRPGDQVDVDESDAQQLLNMRRAVMVAASRAVVVSDQPAAVSHGARKPRPRKPRQT